MTTTPTPALQQSPATKPCPFCGNTDEIYVGAETYCDNCGAEGPSYFRLGKPVATWNDRAAQAQESAPSDMLGAEPAVLRAKALGTAGMELAARIVQIDTIEHKGVEYLNRRDAADAAIKFREAFDAAPKIERPAESAPSSETIDTPEFRALAHDMMTAFDRLDGYSGKKFIAHIDAALARRATAGPVLEEQAAVIVKQRLKIQALEKRLAERATAAPSGDDLYAAWHKVGADVAGLNFADFMAALDTKRATAGTTAAPTQAEPVAWRYRVKPAVTGKDEEWRLMKEMPEVTAPEWVDVEPLYNIGTTATAAPSSPILRQEYKDAQVAMNQAARSRLDSLATTAPGDLSKLDVYEFSAFENGERQQYVLLSAVREVLASNASRAAPGDLPQDASSAIFGAAANDLPPLPEAFDNLDPRCEGAECPVYTADQMCDYGRACLASNAGEAK